MTRIRAVIICIAMVALFLLVTAVVLAQQTGVLAPSAVQATSMTAQAKADRALGKMEKMEGMISLVDTDKHTLVVTGPNGISYHFKAGKMTRVKITGQPAMFDDLANHVNKQVSIEFMPMVKGNRAHTIEITG